MWYVNYTGKFFRIRSKTSYHAIASACLLLETLGNGAPVDNVPDGAKVFGLAVLVLEVVGVLPCVDAQQRLQVASNRVLVRAGDDAEGARGLVLDEPSPAGALDSSQRSVGLLLEVVKGAKVLGDGSLSKKIICVSESCTVGRSAGYHAGGTYGKLASGLTTAALAVGGEVLPEERVVDVAATVEVEERGLRSGRLGVVLGLRLGQSLDGGVEAVDVGLVVLGVVQLHDLARDGGLESGIVIW